MECLGTFKVIALAPPEDLGGSYPPSPTTEVPQSAEPWVAPRQWPPPRNRRLHPKGTAERSRRPRGAGRSHRTRREVMRTARRGAEQDPGDASAPGDDVRGRR